MNESDIVRRAISKNKMITRLNPPQKNGCVSGRVNNVVAFYINRRKKPRLHYLLHVRGIGVNNEKWSEAHANELGGMHKLATKSSCRRRRNRSLRAVLSAKSRASGVGMPLCSLASVSIHTLAPLAGR